MELSTRDVRKFQLRRREEVGVNTEKTLMDTLRVFLRWCERIDAVQPGLWKCAKPPNVPDEKKASDRALHREEAQPILDHLAKYEYASIEHVAWLLLVETGVRLGALRALDVEDYRSDCEPSYVEVVHRPETGTPIKNGSEGERWIGLSDEACEIVDDYLAHQRPDVTDSYGREPLFATAQGRVAKTTIRKYIYKWSRPCEIGLECPHDRVPEECTAATDVDRASKCPSSLTPHPIRRGYITYLLLSGVEIGVVCARCNVSPAIIEQHYDVRSEEDKMRQRQDVLREILNQPVITRSTPKIRDSVPDDDQSI